jgi:hypothetical protein
MADDDRKVLVAGPLAGAARVPDATGGARDAADGGAGAGLARRQLVLDRLGDLADRGGVVDPDQDVRPRPAGRIEHGERHPHRESSLPGCLPNRNRRRARRPLKPH